MTHKTIYLNKEYEDCLNEVCFITGRNKSTIVQEALLSFMVELRSAQAPELLGHRLNSAEKQDMLGFTDVVGKYKKQLGKADMVCVCGAGWITKEDGSYQPVNLKATEQCTVYGGSFNVD